MHQSNYPINHKSAIQPIPQMAIQRPRPNARTPNTMFGAPLRMAAAPVTTGGGVRVALGNALVALGVSRGGVDFTSFALLTTPRLASNKERWTHLIDKMDNSILNRDITLNNPSSVCKELPMFLRNGDTAVILPRDKVRRISNEIINHLSFSRIV